MSGSGPGRDASWRAASLTVLLALGLGGVAVYRLAARSPGPDGATSAASAPASAAASALATTEGGLPTCPDPVAVAWPGAGERLGCLSALPRLLALGARETGCRLAAGASPQLLPGERVRISLGEGGACLLRIEALPGAALHALGLPIDLNRASAEDLQVLQAIGPERARAVVAEREANGRFSSVEELTRVSGIGPKTVEAIRAQVTVVKTRRVEGK